MRESGRIRVSVVHAEPDRAFRVDIVLAAGATVADAIEESRIRTSMPGIEVRPDRLGIFARRTKPDAVLHDGDRVEIYRPLRIDPKDARRQRARGGDLRIRRPTAKPA